MKRILIGHSKTGSGHQRIAEAIKKALLLKNPSYKIDLKDCLEISFYNPSNAYNASITTLAKPFETVHALTNNPKAAALFKKSLRLTFGKHQQRLLTGYDAIVSTHPFFAKAVLWDPKDLAIPYYSIMTNITFHDSEFDHLADIVFVPSKKAYQRAQLFLPAKRVILSGIPIQPGFKRVKHKLSGPFLIMGGGQGVGIEEYIQVLVEKYPNRKKIVITGTNKKLKDKLDSKRYSNMQVKGFVSNIATLMADASIVISKPGPSTMEEAASSGVPFVALKGVGAQEKSNHLYVEEMGFGLACLTPKMLNETIEKITWDYPAYIQKAKQFGNGANIVAEKITADLNKRR